ncbi:MAG TPA: hypothetical protein HA271_01715 [Methanobacterium subterraneum]|uniref:Uncharacterized protein n=1 Tax=Methanobacterium subterraneum TaxID=59277 RepID=A0A7J4TGM1_9EURY|nr:hypothetical protein [Methanobacterium subterraneum]
MDEKGYLFTPTTLLLFIPIIIIAIAYSGILNDLTMVSNLAIGGDVTSTTALNVFSVMEKGTSDAGRSAAFSATRKVIDEKKFFVNTGPESASKAYIKERILYTMNDYIIQSCKDLEAQTGREIYLNNISVNNQTTQLIYDSDISITQENPYGFYVYIRGGIPIRVTQKDQTFEGYTPNIKVPISVQGLEDPYIWLNTDRLTSNLFFSYPEYKEGSDNPYNFDIVVDNANQKIQNLWDCLNGTSNPSDIGNRPYYFPDPNGLSFFDRLENRTISTSTADTNARLSTFIIGDPLYNYHNTSYVSHLDHEYFTYPTQSPTVTDIKIKYKGTEYVFTDPTGYTFYISTDYLNYFKLKSSYN